MKAQAITKTSTAGTDQGVGRQTHEAMFSKVLDGRKQPVRGLWERNGRSLRLDQVKRIHVNGFIERRMKTGMSPRTVNLDVIALRNVLNACCG